jgi:hypothetical protein
VKIREAYGPSVVLADWFMETGAAGTETGSQYPGIYFAGNATIFTAIPMAMALQEQTPFVKRLTANLYPA